MRGRKMTEREEKGIAKKTKRVKEDKVRKM